MLARLLSRLLFRAEEARLQKEKKSIGHLGSGSTIRTGLKIVGGEHISIGEDFYAGPDCRIEAWDAYEGEKYNPVIRIGNRVSIQSGCHIGAIRSVEIGDDTLLGAHVMIIDHDHGSTELSELEISPAKRKLFSKGGVTIGEKCWLGENSVVLSGVTIGKCCVIGANAVVTQDVPDYSVAAGNPAKIIKHYIHTENHDVPE